MYIEKLSILILLMYMLKRTHFFYKLFVATRDEPHNDVVGLSLDKCSVRSSLVFCHLLHAFKLFVTVINGFFFKHLSGRFEPRSCRWTVSHALLRTNRPPAVYTATFVYITYARLNSARPANGQDGGCVKQN